MAVAAETHSSSIDEPTSGDQWSFYVNSSHELAYWSYTPVGGWTDNVLGGSVESGTSPSAFMGKGGTYKGDLFAYYVNKNNELAYWSYTPGGGWTDNVLGGSVESGTSPSAIMGTGSKYGNYLFAFYINKSDEMAIWYYNETAWVNTTYGGSVEAGTSPSAFMGTGKYANYLFSFYINKSDEMAIWYYNETAWVNTTYGGSVEAGTSPSAFMGAGKYANYLFSFYINKSDEMAIWYYNETVWVNTTYGGSVEAGTSPSAFMGTGATFGEDLFSYYVNKSDEIETWYYDGNAWSDYLLGGSVEADTSPSALMGGGSEMLVFYFHATTSALWSWAYTGSWHEAEL